MWEPAERAWFHLCLGLGWLLRSARYSEVRAVCENGELHVRKGRSFYAPFLVRLGNPLLGILDTGVRVLPRADWEERERLVYGSLYGITIRNEDDGALVLPCFAGETLAALLEDPGLGDRVLEGSVRDDAIERAVVALAGLHRLGLTHGDAMAENVLVDLEAGTARWIDFETVHDSSRPMAWRRADDVRALLATCLVRTASEDLARTLRLILDAYLEVYPGEEMVRALATSFTSVWRRPLTFHLAQAGLSFERFRRIGRSLRRRPGR